MGVHTIILEETPWLGGMLTSAGVSAVDGNWSLRGGIFGEFCDSLAGHYGSYDSLNTGWVSNILFEPSAGNEIFHKMAASEPYLDVIHGAKLLAVRKKGTGWKVRISENGRERNISAHVLVDATELGDIAASCGVPYHIGMDSRDHTGESIAPENANDVIQDLTYVAILKDYGKGTDMTVPRPDGYDPSNYANSAAGPASDPETAVQKLWSPREMIGYGRLPVGKYMIKWPIEGNDFYANAIDQPEAVRDSLYREAKDFTLGFIYYIQTEYGMKNLGIADDEFPTEDGLPFIPYHRESRRIEGEVLFTIDDAASPYSREQKLYRTGIAVGDYAVDHHHYRHPDWQELPELHFYPIPSFSVPLGTMIPASDGNAAGRDFSNLIVAEKSVSVSNIMNGATRLQPVVIQLGQAAGALAALAALSERDVKEVGVREVQDVLLDSGGYLLPLLDVSPDDRHFAALQKIACTGILECEGRNEGWTNQTWFRADDIMKWEEVSPALYEYWPDAGHPGNGPVSAADAMDFIFSLGNGSSVSGAEYEKFWTGLGLGYFDLDRTVTRLEFAVLLNAVADPFHAYEVRYDGTLVRNSRLSMVKPLVGSGGHGHVFVGASVPHGMVQAGPNNVSEGWDWCSGYHDSDQTIAGFAQNHLSGTGIADMGEIVFMPVTSGNDWLVKGTGNGDGYAGSYSKQDEKVRPGYYEVLIRPSGISAAVTASERVARYRYTWPEEIPDCPALLLDLMQAPKSIPSRKGCLDSRVKVRNSTCITGYRRSDEWAGNMKVYFAASFSEPVESYSLYEDGHAVSGAVASGDNVQGQFVFPQNRKCLEVKTAISYVSEEGALLNLCSDASRTFAETKSVAEAKWEKWLSKIEFEGITPETDTVFYTAMYHAAMAPQLFSDADGSYFGADGRVRKAENHVPHSVFSLWDTYRALSPLYTLIDEDNDDYIRSLMSIARESGRLPVWHLAGHETDCMTGVHSVPVMADAALKSLNGTAQSDVDPYEVLELVRTLDDQPVPGMAEIKEYGYVPADKVNWSVSRALENCIDEDAVARLAWRLGDTATAEYYAGRAEGYRNYFDAGTGFMRGRMSDGGWRTPFDPSWSMHEEADYVEGNAWQYTWLVPHDPEGLISLFGSKDAFIGKLDALLTADSALNEGASADITGMIGQFAHGNEPGHHIPYLYAYAGKQYRTSELVRQICREFYSTSPDGLIGNEDCGQMSAWYIFSALGLYPVEPVGGKYVFGSPLADSAVIHTSAGTEFRIIAENNNPDNIYIRSVTLNGKPYHSFWISHEDIMKGGELRFMMGSRP